MSPTVLDVIIVADVEWRFTPCNVRTNLFCVGSQWRQAGWRIDDEYDDNGREKAGAFYIHLYNKTKHAYRKSAIRSTRFLEIPSISLIFRIS